MQLERDGDLLETIAGNISQVDAVEPDESGYLSGADLYVTAARHEDRVLPRPGA
jgi:hypothetical protein